MKINLQLQKFNNIQSIKTSKQQKYQSHSQTEFVSYPANYYMTNFRGANIAKMYEEYNWYINHDRIPAIKAFLKMSAPKEEMDEFLTHILNTADRSYEFIDSIVAVPREWKDILKALKDKVGEYSKNVMPFFYDSPYNAAYSNYIKEKYNRANSIVELLKVRPDWSEEALLNKYEQKHGNRNLIIGKIPKRIPKNHLYQIVPYLKTKADVGVKQRKQIEDLVLDGITYKFLYYTEGKSSKHAFRVEIPAYGKTYVIKLDCPHKRSLDNAFSIGTLAKIDGYLTANNSRNSAPLCYYDHENNFSIYKYIQHTHVNDRPNDLTIIKKHLPDFKALCLDYNDTVGYKNFFKLDEKSIDTQQCMTGYAEAIYNDEWISVDNDHVTYNNILQPSVNGYHKTLPNAMGIAV